MPRFNIRYNPFNGAEISITDETIDASAIDQLIQQLSQQSIDLIWFTLPIQHAYAVPILTDAGFVFHLCQEDKITLIRRLKANSLAPFAPTHTLGVGGVVQHQDGRVLLVRDRMMNGKGFKIPGGYVDLGENIEAAVKREVFEETGIEAQFHSVVGVVSKHPHQFNKSNQYFVCSLTANTTEINVIDTHEIELAAWLSPEDFIADEDSSRFHRHLVASLIGKNGLSKSDFKFDSQSPAQWEMLLA
ncbi:NUDIX hydrolase [Reinekea thalattae]|uniref:NUDIX domain-containing protein n=1 Tax=Reinekea thalattae TaxID=2593301 RepID=A0A5C8ZBI8_9GAMM|nr:NUDIX domain-containing protein [Reinekea thalattae]TXR54558.1 NUDIX domain-containing protein [Reinekea thalattae]